MYAVILNCTVNVWLVFSNLDSVRHFEISIIKQQKLIFPYKDTY